MVQSKAFYANTIGTESTSSSKKIKGWKNIDKLKNGNMSDFASVSPSSNSGSYPKIGQLTFSKFNFTGIPDEATITSLIFEYNHNDINRSSGGLGILAPTLKTNGIPNVEDIKLGKPVINDDDSNTGVKNQRTVLNLKTPITLSQLKKISFNLKYGRSESNQNAYPASWNGFMLSIFCVKVEYILPDYSLSSTFKNKTGYVDDVFNLDITLKNKNKCVWNNNVDVSVPSSFTVVEMSTDGKVSRKTEVGATNLLWQPQLSLKKTHSVLHLKLKAVQECKNDIVTCSTRNKPDDDSTLKRLDIVFNISNTISADFTTIPPQSINVGGSFDFIAHFKAEKKHDNKRSLVFSVRGAFKEVKLFIDGVRMYLTPESWEDSTGVVWDCYEVVPDVSDKLETTVKFTVESDPDIFKEMYTNVILTEYEFKNTDVTCETFILDKNRVPYICGFELEDYECDLLQDGGFYNVITDLFVADNGYTDSEGHKQKRCYPEFIPDNGNNHSIAVVNTDLFEILYDFTGHTDTRWVGSDCTVEKSDNNTKIIPDTNKTGIYSLNYPVSSVNDIRFIFDYTHEESTNLYNKYMKLHDNLIFSLADLGVEESSHIRLSIETQSINGENTRGVFVKVDDEDKQFLKKIDEELNLKFNLLGTESIIFSGFRISQSEKIITSDELLQKAYQMLYKGNKSVSVGKSNVWQTVSASFEYDDDFPVIILILGENYFKKEINTKFLSPCIVADNDEESPVYKSPGNFIRPAWNIVDSKEYAVGQGHTSPIVLEDLSDITELDDNSIIRGVGVSMDVIASHETRINCSLNEQSSRSVLVPASSQDPVHVEIGGDYDRWDCPQELLSLLTDLKLSLELLGDTSTNVQLNNLRISVNTLEIDTNQYACFVDGEDTRVYGLLFNDIIIPEGITGTANFLDLKNRDNSLCTSLVVNKKEITLKFYILGHGLRNSTELLHQIGRLFTNNRDRYNRPIPKIIRFSHLPDRYFEFINEKGIDNNLIIHEYECSISLILPDGLAFREGLTSTGAIGVNNSLINVYPTIKISNISLTEDIIITEIRNSQGVQTMKISNPKNLIKESSVIEINCEQQQCFLYNEIGEAVDITWLVDYNCTWFLLEHNYEFQCSNAKIESVTFQERI